MNLDSHEYIATVNQKEKTDLDQIIDYMVMEGTGLTRPQALAYFEKLVQAYEHFIEMRGGVSTPLCNVRTTITGVFQNRGDKFDPQRHSIQLRMSPGSRLKELKSRLKLKKEDSREHTPDPAFFIDGVSETTNRWATPQSIFMIPPLLSGKYTIVVQALMRRHKSIRGGILKHLLTVC